MKITGRKIRIAVLLFCGMIVCFLIGQLAVGSKGSIMSQRREEASVYYLFSSKSDEIIYGNQQASDDYPGGQTVGLVSDSSYGDWYLLTPGTSFQAGIILDDEDRILTFTYLIHENVAELSDGAALTLTVTTEYGETVLFEEEMNVTSEAQDYELNLNQWEEEAVRVEFSVSPEEDDTGDWIVIENAVIL